MLKLESKPVPKSKTALQKLIADKEREMREAAKRLDFELAGPSCGMKLKNCTRRQGNKNSGKLEA